MISIVIPVFNSEKYIDTCLNSVLDQTYKDFEIIIVDDGSTDSSVLKCENYSKKHKNIFVYKKDNEGPSAARNYGVKKTNGELITFVDSDDYIHKDCLKTLYDIKTRYNAEISTVGIKVIYDIKQVEQNEDQNVLVVDGKKAVEMMLYQKNIDTSPCGLLVDKKIILDNPFPNGKYHEDDFTTYKYFLTAQKVAVCTRKLYYYLQREGSIMHSSGKVNYDEIEAANNLVYTFSEFGDDLKKAAESKKYSNYCQVLYKEKDLKQIDRKTYNEIVKYLKDNKFNILLNKNTRLKNKIAAASMMLGTNGLKTLWKLKELTYKLSD